MGLWRGRLGGVVWRCALPRLRYRLCHMPCCVLRGRCLRQWCRFDSLCRVCRWRVMHALDSGKRFVKLLLIFLPFLLLNRVFRCVIFRYVLFVYILGHIIV